MHTRTRASWIVVYALGALTVGAIVAAVLVVGPAAGSTSTQSRIVTVQQGVVQSTVSGSGTLAPASKVGVNFATSGTLMGVFVSVGDHVTDGELLAEIDPTSAASALRSAQMSLANEEAAYQATVEGLTPAEAREDDISAEQARASARSAQQSLREAEETARSNEAVARATLAQSEQSLRETEQSVKLESSTQQDLVGEAINQRATDEKAVTEAQAQLEEARSQLTGEKNQPTPDPTKLSAAETKVSSAETSLKSAQAKVAQDDNSVTSAQNNQAATALKGQQSIASAHNAIANDRQSLAATRLKDQQSIAQARTSVTTAEQSLRGTLTSNEAKSAPPTHATLVSAENGVRSARLNVASAHHTLEETKLYAPTAGVVASIKSSVGETVSGSGSGTGSGSSSGSGTDSGSGSGSGSGSDSGTSTSTNTRSSTGGTTGTSLSSSSSSATGASGSRGAADSTAGTSGAGNSGTGASGTSGESSTSSSALIELVDVRGYQLVVPLSESEIARVHVGQIATVTVEALEGRKLAAHVTAVGVLSTSSSGVVSYDVTFQLDQTEPALKPGMSASAEIVVAQAEGVNVPTSAISADTVTVVEKDGRHVRRPVVTGLAGNSTTIILSGLQPGEQIAQPVASASSATSLTSRLGLTRRAGGFGGLAGGLGGSGLGGGGASFFRGGG